MSLDLRELLAFAEETARAAGDVILTHDRVSPGDAPQLKGVRDPVTAADLASERLIVERLRARSPEMAIFAEEETREGGVDGLTWFVDPLDGTVNFSQAHPFFAVSIALYDGPEPLVGVVHAPRLRETFCAARGLGATLNGAPIAVSSKTRFVESLLATGFAYKRHELADNNVAHFADFVLGVRGMRRAGSAALDLAYLAAGRLDGYWEAELQPFDVAAGALLVREAGGVVSDWQAGETWLHSGRIVASCPALHAGMRAVLAGAPIDQVPGGGLA
ncbi:MAG: inositol monophosphatase [Planctomycetota bacterium]|nr:MAG: inositol monophosphatase [Planctomycetota bacterium]